MNDQKYLSRDLVCKFRVNRQKIGDDISCEIVERSEEKVHSWAIVFVHFVTGRIQSFLLQFCQKYKFLEEQIRLY